MTGDHQTPDDLTAMRIGRAVLASKVTDTGRVQMPPPNGVLVTSAEAYHGWLLAQGEAE
jgi:hypothetical protein